MMDWFANEGGMLVLITFLVMFIGFAAWAYAPSNKKKLEGYAHIPLKVNDHGQ